MRVNRILSFILFFGFTALNLVCQIPSQEQKETVLFLIDAENKITEFSKKDGNKDNIWGKLNIQWKDSSCILLYPDEHGNTVEKEIQQKESAKIILGLDPGFDAGAYPITVYLLQEDDPVPEELDALIREKKRKEQWQAQYGSYEQYAASRDAKKEKDLIQKALDAVGISLTVEYWYDAFLESTWENADTFIIINAYAEKGEFNCLTLKDDKNNTIQIYGDNQFLDAVYYNDELYYWGYGIQ